jgi:hypothetical protein
MVGRFWRPYIRQAVGGVLNLMVLIDGTEERAAIQLLHQSASSNPTRQLLPALYKDFRNSQLYTLALKMATAMFAETLDNIQLLTRLIPESRSCTILIQLCHNCTVHTNTDPVLCLKIPYYL